MAEDDQEWIEGDVRRSSLGGVGIRHPKRKRKKRDAEKFVARKPTGGAGGGSGAPAGRTLIKD
jgi:hypothetical protein